MENFEIESFTRQLDRDGTPGTPTMRMAEVLSDDVVLEGLSPDAVADFRQRSGDAIRSAMPLASPTATPAFRMEASLAKGQRLESICGRLPFLRVGHCRMSPIPPIPPVLTGDIMIKRDMVVHDLMQSGYTYCRTAPVGRSFHPGFKPEVDAEADAEDGRIRGEVHDRLCRGVPRQLVSPVPGSAMSGTIRG